MTDYLVFAARGRNSWWRYIVSLATACSVAIVLYAVMLACLSAARLIPRDFASYLQVPRDPAIFFAGMAMAFGALLAGFLAAIGVIQNKEVHDVIGRWSWAMVLRGAAIWGAAQVILILIDFLIAPQGFSFIFTAQTAVLAVFALAGLSIQTFAEEFIFRGWLTQGLLLATKRPLAAAALSGLAFGLLHVRSGVPQTIQAIAFGIVCSLIAIRTGGIAFTFGLHLVNNYFGAVIFETGADIFRGSPGVVALNMPQLVWPDLGLTVAALIAVLTLVEGRGVLSAPANVRQRGSGDCLSSTGST